MAYLLETECYGIRGTALDWVQSYLTDRKWFVKMGDHCSQCLDLGSVLGPKLFILYTNDLCMVFQLLFADDTHIFLFH